MFWMASYAPNDSYVMIVLSVTKLLTEFLHYALQKGLAKAKYALMSYGNIYHGVIFVYVDVQPNVLGYVSCEAVYYCMLYYGLIFGRHDSVLLNDIYAFV